MNMDVGRRGSGRTRIGALLVFGLAVLPGCVSTGGKKGVPEQAPTGPVAQVQSLWQGRIVNTRDPVHQGAPLPGVAGRVYLFGQDFGTGLKAKGKLLVDLCESDPRGPDGQPRLLEHYEFPDEVLQRLLRKDSIIGWGYTVFLPWPEYNPEIKHVQLKVCFAPEQGTSMYEQPHQLTVRNDQAPAPPAVVERVVPAIAEDVNQTRDYCCCSKQPE